MAPQLRRAIRELFRASRASAAAVRAAGAPPLRTSPPAPSPALGDAAASVPRVRQRFDEWDFLRDLEGEGAKRLLREEDSAAEAFFADTMTFQAHAQNEAAWLLKPEAESGAEVHGPFRYFQRYSPEGMVIFCRAPLDAPERVEVLLDTGKLAQESEAGLAEVTVCKVSDDHRVVGYIADMVGDESYELCFRTLGASGADEWKARLPGVRSFEFLGGEVFGSADGGLDILAVHMDPHTRRASRIMRHRVTPHGGGGDGVASGELLWHERNEAAYLEVFRTKDREFVLLSSNTKDTSEVRVVSCFGSPTPSASSAAPAPRAAAGAAGQPRLLLAPREGVEYFAEHRAGHFYVVSNHERPDFSVYRLTEGELGSPDGGWAHLKPFFTPPGGLHVTDADLLANWLVLYGHDAAEPRLCVVPLGATSSSGSDHAATAALVPQPAQAAYLAALPSPVGSVEPGINAETGVNAITYTFRSPLEPGAMYSLDLPSGKSTLLSKREWHPGGGPGPEAFSCHRLLYPARDGERVPLTLLRPRADGTVPRPCLLHVYGAYGSNLVPDFRPEHIVLLRRGWVVAWAHVRGGGERGREWHSAARQLRKARSVLDLADAAQFLIARGIVAPGALCAKAASAGGLALGAFVNSPEGSALLAGAIMEVPFVDVLTGMSDPDLPLTVHEFAEWGDPRDSAHEANLRSLSPYENVGPHRYPRLYLSCALADARVPAWMPLKLAARLRARAPRYLDAPHAQSGVRRRRATAAAENAQEHEEGEEPCVVLHCTDGGHGGASDWHGRSEEFARQLAFLQKAVGLPV